MEREVEHKGYGQGLGYNHLAVEKILGEKRTSDISPLIGIINSGLKDYNYEHDISVREDSRIPKLSNKEIEIVLKEGFKAHKLGERKLLKSTVAYYETKDSLGSKMYIKHYREGGENDSGRFEAIKSSDLIKDFERSTKPYISPDEKEKAA